MSPSNINSFVGDLVQMAQAMEQLPKVEAERDELKINLDRALDTVQSRELRIIDLNATIAELNNKVRSLEVERDDASFRVLEAEEQTHTTLDRARTARASLEAMIRELDPPKPEPETEPQGSSEPNPTTNATDSEPKSEQTSVTSSANEGATLGQSENPPTASQTEAPYVGGVSSGTTESVVTGTNLEPTHGPYFGKRYVEVEGYITRWDWVRGGGTEADYDWRPARNHY